MQPWEIAHGFLGTPFVHMGRSPSGCDCVGLAVLVAQTLGLAVEDSAYYGREPSLGNRSFGLLGYLERNLGPPVDRPYQVNDLVAITWHRRLQPSHVGIVAPHRWGLGLVHCYAVVGEVVYHRIDAAWHNRIVKVYPWPAKH